MTSTNSRSVRIRRRRANQPSGSADVSGTRKPLPGAKLSGTTRSSSFMRIRKLDPSAASTAEPHGVAEDVDGNHINESMTPPPRKLHWAAVRENRDLLKSMAEPVAAVDDVDLDLFAQMVFSGKEMARGARDRNSDCAHRPASCC